MRYGKIKKIVLSVCFSILLIASLFGCKNATVEKTVALNYVEAELLPRESVALKVSDYSGTVEWNSNAEAIATVDATGNVTGVSFGKAVVTAKTENAVLECAVNVVASKTGTDVLWLDANCIDGLSGTGKATLEQTYKYGALVYNGTKRSVLEACSLSSDSDCIVVNEEERTFFAAKTGKANLTASAQVNGVALSKKYTVTVADNRALIAENGQVVLLTPTDLKGQNVTENVSRRIKLYELNCVNGKKEFVENETVSFTSDDETVVSVNGAGELLAKRSGFANVVCRKDGRETTVGVCVYCPIYDAQDLDILSLVTYRESEETAREILSRNYLFMNDIDYGTHERNYILPIASVTLGSVTTSDYSTCGYSASTLSYYSLAWKEILQLKDKEFSTPETGTFHVLYKNETEEFQGINPNGLRFTGVLDGNGYAIKNAWFMYDNVLGQHWIVGWQGVYYSFVGMNEGTIRNIEFENVNIPNSATRRIDGKYYEAAAHESGANPSDNPNAFHNIYMGMTTPCNDEEFATLQENASKIASIDKTTVKIARSGRHWGATSETSAMVIVNYGSIENVHYANVLTTRGSVYNNSVLGNGLVVVNNGIVKSCIIGLTLKNVWIDVIDTANAIASVNRYEGTVKNCSVYIVDSDKRSALDVQKVKTNEGYLDGSNRLYNDLAEFNAYAFGYDSELWDLCVGELQPKLKKNFYRL